MRLEHSPYTSEDNMAVIRLEYQGAAKDVTYVLLTGTAGEVLQALADENVNPKHLAFLKSDCTIAYFHMGGS